MTTNNSNSSNCSTIPKNSEHNRVLNAIANFPQVSQPKDVLEYYPILSLQQLENEICCDYCYCLKGSISDYRWKCHLNTDLHSYPCYNKDCNLTFFKKSHLKKHSLICNGTVSLFKSRQQRIKELNFKGNEIDVHFSANVTSDFKEKKILEMNEKSLNTHSADAQSLKEMKETENNACNGDKCEMEEEKKTDREYIWIISYPSNFVCQYLTDKHGLMYSDPKNYPPTEHYILSSKKKNGSLSLTMVNIEENKEKNGSLSLTMVNIEENKEKNEINDDDISLSAMEKNTTSVIIDLVSNKTENENISNSNEIQPNYGNICVNQYSSTDSDIDVNSSTVVLSVVKQSSFLIEEHLDDKREKSIPETVQKKLKSKPKSLRKKSKSKLKSKSKSLEKKSKPKSLKRKIKSKPKSMKKKSKPMKKKSKSVKKKSKLKSRSKSKLMEKKLKAVKKKLKSKSKSKLLKKKSKSKPKSSKKKSKPKSKSLKKSDNKIDCISISSSTISKDVSNTILSLPNLSFIPLLPGPNSHQSSINNGYHYNQSTQKDNHLQFPSSILSNVHLPPSVTNNSGLRQSNNFLNGNPLSFNSRVNPLLSHSTFGLISNHLKLHESTIKTKINYSSIINRPSWNYSGILPIHKSYATHSTNDTSIFNKQLFTIPPPPTISTHLQSLVPNLTLKRKYHPQQNMDTNKRRKVQQLSTPINIPSVPTLDLMPFSHLPPSYNQPSAGSSISSAIIIDDNYNKSCQNSNNLQNPNLLKILGDKHLSLTCKLLPSINCGMKNNPILIIDENYEKINENTCDFSNTFSVEANNIWLLSHFFEKYMKIFHPWHIYKISKVYVDIEQSANGKKIDYHAKIPSFQMKRTSLNYSLEDMNQKWKILLMNNGLAIEALEISYAFLWHVGILPEEKLMNHKYYITSELLCQQMNDMFIKDFNANLRHLTVYESSLVPKLKLFLNKINVLPSIHPLPCMIYSFLTFGIGIIQNAMTSDWTQKCNNIYSSYYQFIDNSIQQKSVYKEQGLRSLQCSTNVCFREFVFRNSHENKDWSKCTLDMSLMMGGVSCPAMQSMIDHLPAIIKLKDLYSIAYPDKCLRMVNLGFFESPTTNPGQNWHTDYNFVNIRDSHTILSPVVTVLISLQKQLYDECGGCMGSTVFALGSHHPPQQIQYLCQTFEDDVESWLYKVIQPILDAGDLICFAGNIMHFGGAYNYGSLFKNGDDDDDEGDNRIVLYAVFHLLDANAKDGDFLNDDRNIFENQERLMSMFGGGKYEIKCEQKKNKSVSNDGKDESEENTWIIQKIRLGRRFPNRD